MPFGMVSPYVMELMEREYRLLRLEQQRMDDDGMVQRHVRLDGCSRAPATVDVRDAHHALQVALPQRPT